MERSAALARIAEALERIEKRLAELTLLLGQLRVEPRQGLNIESLALQRKVRNHP